MPALELQHIVIRTAAPRVAWRPNPAHFRPGLVRSAQPGCLIQQNAGLAAQQSVGFAPQTSLAFGNARIAPDEIGNAQTEVRRERLAIGITDGDPLIK
jgi:hypothetical protein